MNIGVQTGGRSDVAALNWKNDDIEQMLGFKGGQFTSVNKLLTFLVALVVTVLIYLLVFLVAQLTPNWRPQAAGKAVEPSATAAAAATTTPAPAPAVEKQPLSFYARLEQHRVGRYFFGHFPMPIFIWLLFAWGNVMLFVKHRKLKYQRKALDLAAVPRATDFVLDRRTAAEVLKRVNKLVDSPSHFILLNRIERALSNLRNIGNVSEVSQILKTQAEYDEEQVGSSYKLVSGFVWAIPVLGFIGTVLGLGAAIGGLGASIEKQGQNTDAFGAVLAGLGTAFDVTFVGLAATLIVQLYLTYLQHEEARFLDECNNYCHANVVSKLRLSDDPIRDNVS
jgi:biopolymer transport protein ExbB/TolQ